MKIYLVGGAVRDMVMGQEPKDRDWVVVGATPEHLLSLGYEQVGASFPVFLHPDTGEEYALARTERKTGVGYHGFETYFAEDVTLEEDLARRDLTINSIAFDPEAKTFTDPFNGIKDIKSRVLRHTSDAFADDPLRVIRLARFAARFKKFSIHPATMELAKKLIVGGELNHLPHERHAAELVKVLQTCCSVGAERFFDTLLTLGAGEHVTFFQSVDLKWLKKLSRVCVNMGGAHVATLLAGLSAERTPDSWWSVQVGGAEAQRLHLLVQQVRDEVPAGERASFMHEWLRQAGTFQRDSKFFHLLPLALTIGHMAGEHHSFTANEVSAAISLTRPVAEAITPLLLAQGVEGKALGEAIKEARLKLLRQLFPT